MKNLKPFDLQAALSGKAVMLRSGLKAYVRHHETELPTQNNMRLVGFNSYGALRTWCENGSHLGPSETSRRDIICMYPETRIINGFEVPAPETEAPECGALYFAPDVTSYHNLPDSYEWDGDDRDCRMLERGLVFIDRDDAIAAAKAMLGIDPYEGDE